MELYCIRGIADSNMLEEAREAGFSESTCFRVYLVNGDDPIVHSFLDTPAFRHYLAAFSWKELLEFFLTLMLEGLLEG